ncbi:KR domain-containing protein [Helicobacter aurati]|uniref:KR domain-containing protein n=1 Tax=Helicobacter aurati TaxID=137778 RepID=A0A3D8J6J7_9HELI|nr:SDR family NAD(P)-dependent oxidoreductase [Helicobacter aurati]RDU73119.1 KR domain-containing protein [Helicobacter aurati]
MLSKQVLIIGATSEISKALVEVFAQFATIDSLEFILCARNTCSLESFYHDMSARYNVKITMRTLDVRDFASHRTFIQSFDNIYGVIYVAGFMPKQQDAQSNFSLAKQSVEVNVLGAISLLELVAQRFEQESTSFIGRFIIAISSVAGERGRASNYLYGCGKAALSTYMEGLANRFGIQRDNNIRVLCVKAGFTQTKSLKDVTIGNAVARKILIASPNELARGIYRELQGKKTCLYYKSIWRWIMLFIKLLPDRIFMRMKL